MSEWIEMGPYNPRPNETLTAIEQEGFGIVCAVLDCEGESVYRILNAVNTQDELLAACRTLLSSLQWEEKRSGTTYHGYEDLIEAVAKAEGETHELLHTGTVETEGHEDEIGAANHRDLEA